MAALKTNASSEAKGGDDRRGRVLEAVSYFLYEQKKSDV